MKDLAELDVTKGASAGVEVELRHPTQDTGVGIFITVLGSDSDVARKKVREQQQRKMSRLMRGGFRAPQYSAEEVERDALELLVACTVSWRAVDGEESRPTVPLNGEELAFTPANVHKVYAEFPWVREQVDAAVADRANFLSK